ncbi:hypothetical protein THAOC_04386 [Thalassiosira oceanica]|uniref:Chitin-binding type-2 domain-containing protein n=1 Tax=Thalassiosira oceanica TaxID=159749 RepID=K0T5B8_THAOC|nr:hypothetical protein THAOC_04386 [Thalassiosira oceanica]|eukprot:EJK73968.1 hypothetical protein THAOC_04386 [Thalassiosira oceanica]
MSSGGAPGPTPTVGPEDELGTGGDGGGDDGGDEDDAPSRFCPPAYTGRAPTDACRGYVQCNAGKEGLSAYCPPNTKFDSGTQQCGYSVVGCEMLVDNGPAAEEAPPANPLDGYCPVDYTGRAPIDGCRGYVSCSSGEAGRSRLCPSGTLFDVMTLACSYSSSVADRCEALNTEPTPAPATREEMQAKRESQQVECPPGHSGNVPLPGCERYIYCQQGVLLQNYTCNAGTLYDPAIQNCNWADSVTCDTTKAPSFAPTLRPSGEPSGRPTGSPVAFDRSGTVYYPDFTRGVCKDDGNFPPNVPNQYLFHHGTECCETYFPGNMDACLEATAPTPSPVREGSPEWYPDYANHICRNDGLAGPHEINFFWTYADCCGFEFLNTDYCLLNPPKEWYPHYSTNSCRNDGRKSEYEYNVFGSQEECCRYEWLDYGICITGGTDEEADEEADEGDEGVEENVTFYPDYEYNVCHCDGKNSEYEINFFTSYNDCCEFALINTDVCRHFKSTQEAKCVAGEPATVGDAGGDPPSTEPPITEPPSGGGGGLVWYADLGAGYCRDDGARPGNFAVFGASDPTDDKRCVERVAPDLGGGGGTSQEEEEPEEPDEQPDTEPDTDVVPCPILNKKRCTKAAHCGWSKGLGKCGYIMGDDVAPTTSTTTTTTTTSTTTTTTAATTPATLPGYIHPYYPDLDRGICLRDGEHASVPDPSSLPLYGSLSECCRHPVLDTKYCRKNSYSRFPTASEKDDADAFPPEEDEVQEDEEATDAVRHPFYPDYFAGLCKNDGNQVSSEPDLFDDLEGCCSVKWMIYNDCMSKSVTSEERDADASPPEEDEVQEDEEATDAVRHPFYRDYFAGLCKNDGNHFSWEPDLFDDLEECCSVKWLIYDECMSKSVT